MKKIFILSLLAITTALTQAAPPTVKQSYDSQIGTYEQTGKNDGPKVEMYLKTVNLPKGYAWCAAFVKWNLLQAGVISATRINAMALSCHNAKNIVFEKRTFYQSPKVGDVFTLYYAKLKRIGHTGFFDKQINESIFQSVEGNTNAAGSREGDGVYRKYRSFKATYSISRWS